MRLLDVFRRIDDRLLRDRWNPWLWGADVGEPGRGHRWIAGHRWQTSIIGAGLGVLVALMIAVSDALIASGFNTGYFLAWAAGMAAVGFMIGALGAASTAAHLRTYDRLQRSAGSPDGE